MPILLNKISTKGGRGVKKVQNLVYVEYGCRLMVLFAMNEKPPIYFHFCLDGDLHKSVGNDWAL